MAAFALVRVEEPPEFPEDYDVPPPRFEEQDRDILAFELWQQGSCADFSTCDMEEEGGR